MRNWQIESGAYEQYESCHSWRLTVVLHGRPRGKLIHNDIDLHDTDSVRDGSKRNLSRRPDIRRSRSRRRGTSSRWAVSENHSGQGQYVWLGEFGARRSLNLPSSEGTSNNNGETGACTGLGYGSYLFYCAETCIWEPDAYTYWSEGGAEECGYWYQFIEHNIFLNFLAICHKGSISHS